ncbi:tetratricopeptide repeat protein [Acinetobacter tianfuensis]|uniref:Sel1 repeat family protein n=1 Tax=Acinetobacter tianfuensis TaxID=2419603 RepID=A0A3A8EX63_9GAMM|nr:SEL1-like repeat protein [Acinetobacter tianfuensis]RKG33461.1 sel1 repeat family protein [Acinetobacter tianfuensis]
MIKQAIKKISSALLHPPVSPDKIYQPHIQEANQDYIQGQYFEGLGVKHHQEFISQTSNTPADPSFTDFRNAMWNFLSAALRGHKEAQYKLGLGYLNGELGLERNFTLAEQWLKKAAAQGHTQANYTLSHLHDDIALS